jgi:hypothetical protein
MIQKILKPALRFLEQMLRGEENLDREVWESPCIHAGKDVNKKTQKTPIPSPTPKLQRERTANDRRVGGKDDAIVGERAIGRGSDGVFEKFGEDRSTLFDGVGGDVAGGFGGRKIGDEKLSFHPSFSPSPPIFIKNRSSDSPDSSQHRLVCHIWQ